MGKPRLTAISTGHSWNDLLIDPENLMKLSEINQWLSAEQHGSIALKMKGIKTKFSVLFNGPVSSLKDIAAAIIGKECGKLVYRTDISTVVSPFIGETEKNIEAVFREAGRNNAVLFFDEADALFGKSSTDEKTSEDKMRIDQYFFEQMDQFMGLVIVAVNMKSNIDERFSRRFRMMISL